MRNRRVTFLARNYSKNKKARTVAMTPQVHDALSSLTRGRLMRPDAPVFVGRDENRLGEDALRYRFACTLRAAEDIPTSKREAFRWHDLRHTCASLMVAAGVPIFDVSKVLGHEDISTTMIYAHFAPEAGRAAAAALGNAFAQ